MRRLALVCCAAAAAAGCGRTAPSIAYLTSVGANGDRIAFTFRSKPKEVSAAYVGRERLAECGSGKAIPLRGKAFLAVHFRPAATAESNGDALTFTYVGPKRIRAGGPLLEAVKTCDFRRTSW
jgi:hypothetical protein